MMSLETAKRVWQARMGPRLQTPSMGIYSHVRDRWGIFDAQPIVLNDRQAGVAIDRVVRQEDIEITQLATDIHGWIDFAMWLALLLGFDLCPPLEDRHLLLPLGSAVPAILKPICRATSELAEIKATQFRSSRGGRRCRNERASYFS